jgi:hypothetical protein
MKKKESKMVHRLIHDYVTTVRGWFYGVPSDKIVTQAVLMSALAHSQDGLDAAEAKRIAAWVEEAHYKFSTLGRIINGEIVIRFFEGDSEPRICYTPHGQTCAKHRASYDEETRHRFG